MSFLDFFKKKESSFQQPEPTNNSSARDLSGVLNSVGVGLIVLMKTTVYWNLMNPA